MILQDEAVVEDERVAERNRPSSQRLPLKIALVCWMLGLVMLSWLIYLGPGIGTIGRLFGIWPGLQQLSEALRQFFTAHYVF